MAVFTTERLRTIAVWSMKLVLNSPKLTLKARGISPDSRWSEAHNHKAKETERKAAVVAAMWTQQPDAKSSKQEPSPPPKKKKLTIVLPFTWAVAGS